MKKIRIVVLSNSFSSVLKKLCAWSQIEVVGVVEGKPRKIDGKTNFLRKVKRSISKPNGFVKFSKDHNVPYHYYSDTTLFENWLNTISPDVMVVFSLSQLLPERIFSIPIFGTINLHLALLPSYRGPNSWFWNYYNTANNNGMSVHFIDKGEDTGNLIVQKEYNVPLGMKSQDQMSIVRSKGVDLLKDAILLVARENYKGIQQPIISPTIRARNIKKEEHIKIVDWGNWEVTRIWHLLRGTELWLDALEQPKGLYAGHRWIVQGYEEKLTGLNNGEIFRSKGQYFVACMDGVIYLSLKFSLFRFLVTILKY
jgi:methionyl-tRNA formyltransferase